jgi:rubrerythrin
MISWYSCRSRIPERDRECLAEASVRAHRVGLWHGTTNQEGRVATDMERGQGAEAVSTTEVLDGLNDLLQLDHDAIGAYQVAIEKLEDPDQRMQITGFLSDHERHVRDLNTLIQELGGTPKNEPHATGPFKEALQSLGGLGGDKGVLMAFRTNELQVRTKYDNYASKAVFWPNNVKALIDRNALDEERHYRWVSETLERMGVAPGEGMETTAATKLREGMSRLDSARGRAGEAVSGAVGTARTRAADGLEGAAERLDTLADQQASAGGARARAAGAAHRMAGGMESTAEFLRTGDAEQLRTSLEQQARANPFRAVLTTFAVGFVIGRILR